MLHPGPIEYLDNLHVPFGTECRHYREGILTTVLLKHCELKDHQQCRREICTRPATMSADGDLRRRGSHHSGFCPPPIGIIPVDATGVAVAKYEKQTPGSAVRRKGYLGVAVLSMIALVFLHPQVVDDWVVDSIATRRSPMVFSAVALESTGSVDREKLPTVRLRHFVSLNEQKTSSLDTQYLMG